MTGLANGTTYTIQLRAVSDVGAGGAGEVTANPQSGETAPGEMVNVELEVRGSTVYFTWDDPDDSSIDYYRYRYDREANAPAAWDVDWTKIPGSTGSTTTWDNSIGSDIVRFYELQAVNDPGTAEDTSDDLFGPATPVTATKANPPGTSPAAPAAPTGLTATATPGQVALSWTVPSGDATVTGYQYHQSIRQDDSGNAIWNPDWTDISESGSTTAGHNLNGLANGTTYTFEVRATNNMDTTSDTTDDIHGAVASVGPVTLGAPGAPTGLAVATADDTGTTGVNEAPTQTTLHLSWTAPADNSGVSIDGYEYRQRASADTEWGEWAATGGTGVTYTVSGLAAGTSYDFQVRAMAGTIGGPESNTAAGTTAIPAVTPAAPTGLSATGVANGVKLTWSNPNDDTINIYGYRQATAEADLSKALWQAFSNFATLTEYTVTGLTAETTYYFQILANNANGDGPASATVSAAAQAAGDGSWTYEVNVDPGVLTPGNAEGSQVTLVATWEADRGDKGEIVSLSGSDTGSVQAEVQSASPQLVGFGFRSTSDLNEMSGSRNAPGDCDDSVADTLTCTIRITVNAGALYAKDTALGITYLFETSLTDFSMTALVNGVATDADIPDSVLPVWLTLTQTEPRKPKGLRVTSLADRQASLAWDSPVLNNPTIDRYEYQVLATEHRVFNPVFDPDFNPESWRNISVTGPDTTTATISGLNNGVVNYIRIRAVNDQSETGTKESVASNAVAVIPNSTPSALRNLQATVENRLVGLTWDPPSRLDSLTGYQLRRSADGGGTWDPDWPSSLTAFNFGPGLTGTGQEEYDFGTEYTIELRAVNVNGPGPAASVTVTPTRNGVAGSLNSISASCEGNAASAGFGDAASINGTDYYGFDIVAAGADPTDGSQWWQVEYMENVAGALDIFHTAWFPQDCFVALTGAVTESIPVTWPPVVGEWSFEAGIDPNPLPSGDENGVTVSLRAVYQVTGGKDALLEDGLEFAFQGNNRQITTAFAASADSRFGIASSLDDSMFASQGIQILLSPGCVPRLGQAAGTIICDFTVLPKLFAKAGAAPGQYTGTITLSEEFTFVARASTEDHAGFNSAQATGAEIGVLDLALEVIPGPPPAPKNLIASVGADVGSSRVRLSWDDPDNLSITGYEYQQTAPAPGNTLDGINDFPDAGSWVQIPNSAPGEANALSYDVNGLTNGDTYYFRIRAVTDGGPGPVSNSVAGIPELAPPAAPTGFTAVPSSRQMVLSWNDLGDSTIDRYQYRQTDTVSVGVPTWPDDGADGDWADIPGSGSGTVDHTVTGLDNDRTDAGGEVIDILYAFQVRAANKDDSDADQFGTGSETGLANPGLLLPAPTISDLTWNPSTGVIRIEWESDTNDSGELTSRTAEFEVSWRRSQQNFGSKLVLPVGQTPATETAIHLGADFGSYTFTVRARNNYGPWSAVATRDFNYPAFTEGLNPSREVDQWAEAGINVGHPVVANLPVDSGNVATYSLNPSSSFAIDAATGQITVAGPISVGAFPVTVTASIRKPGSLDAARTYHQRITINVTSTGPWYELEKLEDSSGAAEDKFGSAVAVGDDGTIVVGVKDTTTALARCMFTTAWAMRHPPS